MNTGYGFARLGSVDVCGADLLDHHGVYDDGWCEGASSLKMRAHAASAMVRLTIWLAPAPGVAATARFAAQADRSEPFVFDVPLDIAVHVHLPCALAVNQPLTLSMLCDGSVVDHGDDVRPLSFRLLDVCLVAQQPERPGDGSGPGRAEAGAGLHVRGLGHDGLVGTGAPAHTLVTVHTVDAEAGTCRSDADGTFTVELNPAIYDGAVHALWIAADGVDTIIGHVVADPRLRTGSAGTTLTPPDPTGDAHGGGTLLASSPAAEWSDSAHLAARRRKPTPGAFQRLQRRGASLFGRRKLSIIMPVFNTPDAWLRTALDSVLAQWCPNWQLICVDDCSSDTSVLSTLEAYRDTDPRITVVSTPRRQGPAAAINAGLAAADGEFVALLEADDFIEATAVWRFLQAASAPEVDLIYSDELLTTDDIETPLSLVARPAFSHDYYLDHPYFVHLVACRRTLAVQVGGFDETMSSSADVDFILRVLESARGVAHIPEVLYRWRTHDSSLGLERRQEVTAAMVTALDRSVKKIDPGATAGSGLGFNQYRIDWPDPGGKVLIVIPTKNRGDLLEKAICSIEVTCPPDEYRIVVIDHASDEPQTLAYLRSIEFRHTVTHRDGDFNFAAMNNDAANTYGTDCPFVLFMNNDVEAVRPDWLSRLRSLAGRPDVGAVCPLLLYPGDEPGLHDRVQHGGVLVGFGGAADHAFKGVKAFDENGFRHTGYNCSLNVVRDFSAVTGACLMMRRSVFDAVGGFDEELRVGFNDTDLCLRTGALGYKVLYDGHTVLYHHESATRRPAKLLVHEEDSLMFVRRWARMIADGDDFYSPLLARKGADHVPARAKGDRRSRSARLRRAGFNGPPFDAARSGRGQSR
ncbi:MAG TPA: glycosyltransferase family 2 protein [Candidatus Elarobacter sp.]